MNDDLRKRAQKLMDYLDSDEYDPGHKIEEWQSCTLMELRYKAPRLKRDEVIAFLKRELES